MCFDQLASNIIVLDNEYIALFWDIVNWENSISHVFGICQKYTVCLFEQEINVKGLIISVSDFSQKAL